MFRECHFNQIGSLLLDSRFIYHKLKRGLPLAACLCACMRAYGGVHVRSFSFDLHRNTRSKRVVEPLESPPGWNCSGSIYWSKRHQRCWLEHCKTKGVRNSGNHDVYSLRVSCLMLSKTRSSQSIMKHKFPLTNPDISYLYYIYTPS